MRGWVLWVSLFVALCVEYAQCNDDQLKLSPYDQRLPECSEDYPRVVKNTTEKAILCPMIRNEEGFLAEWIAYYQMHGFDHIMLFDDGSTDSFAEEIEPWVSAGIVSVRSNWTMESLQIAPGFTRNEFKRRMTTKQLLERVCKKQAQEWGYRYFVSLDLDEFIVVKGSVERSDSSPSPVTPVSIVDSIHDWFQQSGKAAFLIEKYNFASVPHLLEPVNLLQIEAYQSRMRDLRRMSYYTSVMPKIVLQLQGGNNYDENTQEYLATCCHFHGCHGHDPLKDSKFCSQQDGNQKGIMKKGSHPPHNLVINHYSRSLEKYTIKAATWSTASGEVKAGESDEAAASNYDINKFFQRNLGWQIDRTALKYSCQLRETLYKMQKTRPFMRAGTVWYRNAEFGRHVSIPDKRGRYGRPNPEGFHYKDGNPYQYHGSNQLETNLGKNDEKLFAGVQQKIDLVGGVEKRENKNQEGRR